MQIYEDIVKIMCFIFESTGRKLRTYLAEFHFFASKLEKGKYKVSSLRFAIHLDIQRP